MNNDFENKLSALTPTSQSINRDALFFELGKQQKKPNRQVSAFLAGAIAIGMIALLVAWLFPMGA